MYPAEPLPTPERARRNLLVGGVVLAVAAVLFVVAVPLGIRGHGVAHLEVVGEAPVHMAAADVPEQPGAVALRTAPVARAASSTTATVELVGESAPRARLVAFRDGTRVGTGDRIVLDRRDTAEGVDVLVEPREGGADDEWDGSVTVRLTVSQGFLPDTDELDLTLPPS
jgi:hypothetical protein